MVQVFDEVEKEAIYIVIPVVEEKAEKIEEKKAQIKKKLKIRKHAKQHQERINVNKMKKKIDSSMYRATFYNR
jgi:nucleoside diphosphate kinase